MEISEITSFNVIGISVRTTNENGQATKDIPLLWQQLITQNISSKLTAFDESAIVCIYTAYEKDFTAPYTTILGYRVDNLNEIPEGLVGITIHKGNYTKFTAKGKANEPFVYNEWLKIWQSGIDRAYTADFEIYDFKSQDPDHAEVNIFIAVP